MSNLSSILNQKKVFLPFLTCGDPDCETTAANILALAESGADAVILGIPFSDPTAEGSLIQCANIRALAGGATTDRIFKMAEEIRNEISIPLIFMTYANVVFSYGMERFCKRCESLGIEGLIIPDVPFEEKEEFDVVCKSYQMDLISMIAPTSASRISKIASEANGFVFAVSGLGVSDEQSKMQATIEQTVSEIKVHTNIPCIVGFGIQTPAQAAYMTGFADGVIADTAFTEIVAKYGKDSTPYVKEFAHSMIAAIQNTIE